MVRLPAEYQEVEYIESTGTQYIDTGVLPDNNSITWKIKAKFKSVSSQQIMGSGWINGTRFSIASGTGSNFQVAFGAGWKDLPQQKDTAIHHYIVNTYISGYSKIDDFPQIEASVSSATFSEKKTIFLFARNRAGAIDYYCNAYIYTSEIYKNGELIQNLIPCYRKSDNEPGMYDTVTKQFFTNAGTGTFLVGNDVSWDTASLIERRRQILLNTPHITTESANPLTFQTDISANLKDCKVYFEPVQEGSGDPSPDNVRPITGWDGIEVKMAPLYRQWKDTGNNSEWKSGYYGTSGVITSGSKYRCATEYIDVSNINSITFSFANTTSDASWYRIIEYDENKNKLSAISAYDDIATFTPVSGAKYIRLSCSIASLVILRSSNPTSLTLPFPKTLYGGYVDLVKGEVVEEYEKFVLDGVNRWLTAGINTSDSRGDIYVNYVEAYNYFNNGGLSGMTRPNNLISQWDWKSNRFSVNNSDSGDYAMLQLVGGNNPYIRLFIHKSQLGDISDRSHITDSMKAWLSDNPIEISYKPVTPITHQLTPQAIKTLKGINNIWSNANGNIEVKFWKH